MSDFSPFPKMAPPPSNPSAFGLQTPNPTNTSQQSPLLARQISSGGAIQTQPTAAVTTISSKPTGECFKYFVRTVKLPKNYQFQVHESVKLPLPT